MQRSSRQHIERQRKESVCIIYFTTKRILRNLSWAVLMLKARSFLEEISRLWSFLTLLTNPSTRALFFATILLPQHGLGLADILLPSMALFPSRVQIQNQISFRRPETQRERICFLELNSQFMSRWTWIGSIKTLIAQRSK